jgi:fatty acid desaturase
MEFFFNFVFLFFLCFWFSLQFFYQGIKYTWLAYVILIVWPVWIWILPLFFNAPKTEAPNASKKQQKTNNEQKANKEVVIAQSKATS